PAMLTKREMLYFPNILVRAINRYPRLSLYLKRFESEYFPVKNKEHSKSIEFIGFWQNEQYFKRYKNELRKIFTPVNLSSDVLKLKERIQGQNSIALHIRRGDYISNHEAMNTHGVCSLNYYISSVSYVKRMVANISFFVFSDDIQWCKENAREIFNSDDEVHYVEGNSQEVDMWLMSAAKHHIIANSSFSWWGAWLARDANNMTIAPIPWFDKKELSGFDPCPESWIRIKK
ncbi:alpha-1,2-fucosyltransferase, partial [Salmonella enterica]|nr:alpha-1,2-fucosyltransferase [Salmonella enterica]ECO4537463.1 alpha-1,2-fucosyltransferase [Salmonella enterica]